MPISTALSVVLVDSGRHLCTVPESGVGTYVYSYAYPSLQLTPATQALLVGEDPALHVKIEPQQPEPLFLDLQSSDSSVLEPFDTPYIIPFMSDQQLPFFVRKASNQSVTIRVGVPQQFGGSQTSAVVSVLNSVPRHLVLDPNLVEPGGPGLTLRVYADNYGRTFVDGSTILWNGSPRPTTFAPSGACPDTCNVAIQATISADDTANPRVVSIQVHNPSPGGGTSEAAILTIGPNPRAAPVAPPNRRPRPRVKPSPS